MRIDLGDLRQRSDSFLQSESVWMASTNKASDESRRSNGSALLNIGPAGSRPGHTRLTLMFCIMLNYSHLGFRINTRSCFLAKVVWWNNWSLFIWSALAAFAFVWKTHSVWSSVGFCSSHKSSIFLSGQNWQATWSYGTLYHNRVIMQ